MKNLLASSLAIPLFIVAACQPLAAPKEPLVDVKQLTGIWVVESIADQPVIERSTVRIQFGADGDINGNASCNRFFGKYSLTEGVLSIEAPGSTRMMCLPTLMEQEQRLLERLPEAVSAGYENGTLLLRDRAGTPVLKASREIP